MTRGQRGKSGQRMGELSTELPDSLVRKVNETVREGSAAEQVSIPRKTALHILRQLRRLEERLREVSASREAPG